ncbi:BTB/POZ and MATH domain-containing protein 3-like [Triticum aestivum]|uniref:BTB/POZ and MATH domain-containing protein 3-like n=1 Tax=Triticum aestivum TaxID=4565 RepID=UPI001D00ECA4|nr:BTB/POZ and MATH domain-containing protein 3-like [Triticum aestivum]
MSFAGVSVVADGKLLQPSAESAMVYSGTASGRLVVEGYSRVKHLPNKRRIMGHSFTFRAGGYQWALMLFPHGCVGDGSSMCVYLFLDQHVAQPVKVNLQFSFMGGVDKQEPAVKTCDFTNSNRVLGEHHFIQRKDLEQSGHLKQDCLIIRCDFTIVEAAAADAPFVKVPLPPSNICEHLNHLFVTKVGADVMFKVGDEEFAAHRCVLAARSVVFMAELFGPMMEGTTTGVIQIQDMEPNVFDALLRFIYTDSMPEMMKVGGEATTEVTGLRQLLAAADRYDLQRLKLMYEERPCGLIDVSSVAAIIGVAAQHYCCGLKEACLEFLKVQSAVDLRGVMATSEWEHVAATEISLL